LIGSSRVVEFYCNYPSIKISIKTDLLVLCDTGIIKWTETLSVSGETNRKRKHYVNETAMHFVEHTVI